MHQPHFNSNQLKYWPDSEIFVEDKVEEFGSTYRGSSCKRTPRDG